MNDNNFLKVPIEILACPICKNVVRYENKKIICDHCEGWYVVQDNGVPILIADRMTKI